MLFFHVLGWPPLADTPNHAGGEGSRCLIRGHAGRGHSDSGTTPTMYPSKVGPAKRKGSNEPLFHCRRWFRPESWVAMLHILVLLCPTSAQQCSSHDQCADMSEDDCQHDGGCESGGDGIALWYCNAEGNCFDSDHCRNVRRTPTPPPPRPLRPLDHGHCRQSQPSRSVLN